MSQDGDGRTPGRRSVAPTRQTLVVVVTLILGALVLGVSINLSPGDARFAPFALLLAAVWAVGGVAAGGLRLGRTRSWWTATPVRPLLQPVLTGLLLSGVFIIGAVVVARIPALRGLVQDVLDHAKSGRLPVIAAVTALTGIGEEMFFRGPLYAVTVRHRPVVVTTAVYTLTTVATGNAMLVFAAAVLGLVTALQRRVTGGVLAPIITHVVWSMTMLFALPPILGLNL